MWFHDIRIIFICCCIGSIMLLDSAGLMAGEALLIMGLLYVCLVS